MIGKFSIVRIKIVAEMSSDRLEEKTSCKGSHTVIVGNIQFIQL